MTSDGVNAVRHRHADSYKLTKAVIAHGFGIALNGACNAGAERE